MEINIAKLLENGMSPESIGNLVAAEALKQEKKNKAAAGKKLNEARNKVLDAMYDYLDALTPFEKISKDAFVNEITPEILAFEEILMTEDMQQIFQHIDSVCNSKVGKCGEQKNVETVKPVGKTREEETEKRSRCLKFNLDDAAMDKILTDFLRTL